MPVRKLTTILAADVVGYSRQMASDEIATLAALKALRAEVIEPKTEQYNGRLIKLIGDGTLMEFASVVDAVNFAADVQSTIAGRKSAGTNDQRITLRIGINIGDIIVEGDDIYGDGVNIASRLEGLSDPGGLCIAHSVFEQVNGKIDHAFKDAGLQTVKNIPEPVQVYRLQLDGEAQVASAPEHSGTPQSPSSEKPSIAVLPFNNMSGDPEQEFFSDGISEDIITELSRSGSLVVVARNSSFQFRGDGVDILTVGKQLSVGYVLEGSVRKAGQRIRVTAQLIDAATNEHVWAERYDGTLEDIFELQDEITRTIVTTIAGRLDDIHAERLKNRTTTDFNAYEQVLRGQKRLQKYSIDGYDGAVECFEAALVIDPRFARAHAGIGLAMFYKWHLTNDPPDLERAMQSCRTALELDPHESQCHLALGNVHLFRGEHDTADYHFKRASQLNPNDDLIMIETGRYMMYTGDPEGGAELVRLAMQRNPFFPSWYWNILGRCLHTAKHYDEAIVAFERIPTPLYFTHVYLAACHASQGHTDKAEESASRVMELRPDFTVQVFARQLPYQNPQDLEEFLETLRTAGFPD